MLFISFLCLSFLTPGQHASKILMLPLTLRSHVASILEISRALGKLSHECHVVISDSFDVDPETEIRAKDDGVTFVRYRSGERNQTTVVGQVTEATIGLILGGVSVEEVLKTTTKPRTEFQARTLLQENEKFIAELESVGFDMAVVDSTFAARYLYLLAHRLHLPWITYTDYPDLWLMRVPWLPSFVPVQFSTLTPGEMGFLHRVRNFAALISLRLEYRGYAFPDLVTSYQRFGSFGSVEELAERSRLWLLTSHPLLEYPRPLNPNMIEVGGLTTGPPEVLPAGLQDFLDGAEDGVILLSFGSAFSIFPDGLLEKFRDVFDRMEGFRIVWVLRNNRTDVEFSPHIRTGRWLPQNGVLAHPKTRLFITHCGNNGQFEALYHGVPMIGFPFVGDQFHNCHRIQSRGYGIRMDIRQFTSDQLYSNIVRILEDSSFKGRISRSSEIFRRELQRPADKAAYWIDHVIRYGSDHLTSAGSGLNFFQYFMLDVLAAVVVVGVVMVVVVKRVLCWMFTKALAGLAAKRKMA